MKKVFVVYYSRTGYTRRIANELSTLVSSDLHQITEDRSRDGITGYFRSALEAYRERPAKITPSAHPPKDYDLVVFGTPVWAGHTSSPMLAYLQAYMEQIGRYAVFCTEGGSRGAAVLKQMSEIIGKPAEAELILTDKDIDTGRHELPLRRFADALQLAPADRVHAAT